MHSMKLNKDEDILHKKNASHHVHAYATESEVRLKRMAASTDLRESEDGRRRERRKRDENAEN